MSIPVTCLTGFLGAGKTTIALNIIEQIKQQNSNYKIAWLKNEFGENEIDSIMAKQSNLSSVREITNGCICCTAVGKLGDALKELVTVGAMLTLPSSSSSSSSSTSTSTSSTSSTSSSSSSASTSVVATSGSVTSVVPDRIIVETSGSAFPAAIVMEMRRIIERDNVPVRLDAVCCVIDVLNFKGYADTSYTARIQAKYTDLLIFNKVELASHDQYERVLDLVLDLNPDTPRINAVKGRVDHRVLLDMDGSQLMKLHLKTQEEEKEKAKEIKKEEADAAATMTSSSSHHVHEHVHNGDHSSCTQCQSASSSSHEHEFNVIDVRCKNDRSIPVSSLSAYLSSLSSDSVYRVKGVFCLDVLHSQLSHHIKNENATTLLTLDDLTKIKNDDSSSSSSSSLSSSSSSPSPSSSSSSSLSSCACYILNFAFGRHSLQPLRIPHVHATWFTIVMPASSEAKRQIRICKQKMGLKDDEIIVKQDH